MIQEQKDLLLKDLCGRLTYGVKVKFGDSKPALLTVIEHDEFGWQIGSEDEFGGMITIIDNVKPYLFPLSSITEEQWKEITDIQIKESLKSIDSNNDYMSNPLFSIGDLKTLDWCYANHIDYRGLIPMGLANDATGLNIY